MPPEVMTANPKYDTSVDIFSYGILMIHMFSGRWPEPQVGQIRNEPGGMVPITEVERRDVFLKAIGNDHPLMDLILKCIDNYPQQRGHTNEITERFTEMRFPVSFTNQLEMLRLIEADEEEKRTLREEKRVLREEGEGKDREIQERVEEAQAKDQQIEEFQQLKLVHSSEVEQLRLQVRELSTQNQLLKDENEAEVTELKTKVVLNERTLKQERKEFETQLAKEREKKGTLLSEVSRSRSEIQSLQSEVSESKSVNSSLQHTILTLEATNVRKDSEIEAKTRALQKKGATISGMNEQLTRTREYLATKQQVSLFSCSLDNVSSNSCCLVDGNRYQMGIESTIVLLVQAYT